MPDVWIRPTNRRPSMPTSDGTPGRMSSENEAAPQPSDRALRMATGDLALAASPAA